MRGNRLGAGREERSETDEARNVVGRVAWLVKGSGSTWAADDGGPAHHERKAARREWVGRVIQ